MRKPYQNGQKLNFLSRGSLNEILYSGNECEIGVIFVVFAMIFIIKVTNPIQAAFWTDFYYKRFLCLLAQYDILLLSLWRRELGRLQIGICTLYKGTGDLDLPTPVCRYHQQGRTQLRRWPVIQHIHIGCKESVTTGTKVSTELGVFLSTHRNSD